MLEIRLTPLIKLSVCVSALGGNCPVVSRIVIRRVPRSPLTTKEDGERLQSRCPGYEGDEFAVIKIRSTPFFLEWELSRTVKRQSFSVF